MVLSVAAERATLGADERKGYLHAPCSSLLGVGLFDDPRQLRRCRCPSTSQQSHSRWAVRGPALYPGCGHEHPSGLHLRGLLAGSNLRAPVPRSSLPCGNVDPVGVTSTPVIDIDSRTLYVAAMTTPDGGATKQHLIYALLLDDGSTVPGWPVDVGASVSYGGLTFNPTPQSQRGALVLSGQILYVSYGGHFGDCGVYHGWVVGVPQADPSSPMAWATDARGGGIWAPSGLAADDTFVYAAAGNTFGTATWRGGEAIIRLSPGPVFSGATTDFFTPSNWLPLDLGDIDISGTGPVLIDVPGA